MRRAWLLNMGLMLILAGCGGVKESADAGQTDGPPPEQVLPKPDLSDKGPAPDGEAGDLTEAPDGSGNCGNSAIDTGEKCDSLNLAGWTCKDLGYASGTLKCKKDCSDYDKSGCYKCGDGKITAGEKCDGANLAGWTCKALNYDGGTLKCKKDCTDLDKSSCYKCGDFVKNGLEQCDGADLGTSTCKGLSFHGGKLSCDATCKLVKTACTNCGNAKVDTGEQCDGTSLTSKTCKTEGFDGGVLKCTAKCALDKSFCTKATCPNGKIDAGEDCEGTNLDNKKCIDLKYAGGTLSCYGNCKYDTSKCYKCGDGDINTGEKCDGANLGGWSCKALNYDGGALTCKTDCKDLDQTACTKCGDAKKNGTEQCDGTDFGGKACKDVGFHAGTLTCKKDCSLDTALCTKCGNAKIDIGEECDGTNLDSKNCKDFKFDTGSLKCDSKCLLDKSGCALIKCGDGKIEGQENCDKTNLGGKTCKGLGYDGGTLACTANCKFDPAKCDKCGDGKIGGSEKCDLMALDGKTCTSFSPFHSGTLKCKSDCSGHDTTSCNKCGDGAINGTEKCDGAQLGLASCKSLGFDSGALACTTGCLLDTTKCTKCGDGKISGSEKCDGTALGGKTCGSLGYTGGTLVCRSNCTFDTGACNWVIAAHGTGNVGGASVAVDKTGNSLVTGYLDGTSTFGSVTLTSKGKNDIFVAKLGSSGQFLWAILVGGAGDDGGTDIAVDSAGNSFVTGRFAGTSTFGSTTLTSKGDVDIFVAKLDSSGKFLWTTSAGGAGVDRGKSIAVDSAGNSLVTGLFSGSATFGSTTLTSKGSYDIFVTKLDGSGKFLWAISAGGANRDQSSGIAVDSMGNSLVTGYFNGHINGHTGGPTATFGSTKLTAKSSNWDIFVAKLDGSGKFLWVTSAGGGHADLGTGIVVDSASNSFVAGYFNGTATFGSITLTATKGYYDAFVAKLDSSGKFLWITSGGGSGMDVLGSIALDSVGNILVTGWFNGTGTATFGTTTLTSKKINDILVAKLDSSGKFLWATSAGGAGEDLGFGIAVDSVGKSLVTGYFAGTATFGSTTLTSKGKNDVFVWKLGPSGP